MENGNGIELLLVEDNPTDALAFRMQLSCSNADFFALRRAEHLTDALNQLRQKPADIVVLDLRLPDSDGLEALERLHIERPHIPIVVLSALDDPTMATQAIALGAQDYLLKGQLTDFELAARLRFALKRSRRQSTEFAIIHSV